MRVLQMLALLGAGCAEKGDDSGDPGTTDSGWPAGDADIDLCIGGDAVEAFYDESDRKTWDFSGTVISDGPLAGELDSVFGCSSGDLRRALEIEDAGGVRWRVGYGILDASGADVTPPLDLAAGDAVAVRFRYVSSFGSAFGATVRDGDGALVAALEVGTWGPALEAGDYPEVAVERGADAGTSDDECGTRLLSGHRFTGDAALELTPYETGAVSAAGQTLTAYSVAQWDYQEPVGCTDVGGESIWALAR